MQFDTVRVAGATLNQTVGDWAGNTSRIIQAIAAARAQKVAVLALPEMSISGYSLGDRLLMEGTLRRSLQALQVVLPHTEGMVVAVGLPVEHDGAVYNAAAVLCDGKLVGFVPKENLAVGDVQYENRWFADWPRGAAAEVDLPWGGTAPIGSLLFRHPEIGALAVEICEDGWRGNRPSSMYALAGAEIVLNLSASWFTLGKHHARQRLVEQNSQQDHTAYVYTSLIGCDATRLVFDGAGLIAVDGRIVADAPRFRFTEPVHVFFADVDRALLRRARAGEGSFRRQAVAAQTDRLGPTPTVVHMEGQLPMAPVVHPGGAYWMRERDEIPGSLAWLEPIVGRFGADDVPHLELELTLSLGMWEYLRKSRIPGFALALSGGRDSAMCALLVARAFRYAFPDLSDRERKAKIRSQFLTAYLASDHSGSATRQAAKAIAEELGAEHIEAPIAQAVATHRDVVGQAMGVDFSWDNPAHDITLQNVQARLRGSMIWMMANLRGYLLLATSNKSEAAVGYTTMDGDTSGGIAPIADVPKSLVQLWLEWAADFHNLSSIQQVLATPATAELRPPEEEQTDEDDLMPFVVLDRLMNQVAHLGREPKEAFDALWPVFADRYGHDPVRFAAHVEKFTRLFCRAQWKRERFAISFRVTSFDLDPKSGFRFPPVQVGFEQELSELREHVKALKEST